MNKKILKIILTLVLTATASENLRLKSNYLFQNDIDSLLELAEENKKLLSQEQPELDKKLKILQANSAHNKSSHRQGLPIEGRVTFNDSLVQSHEYDPEPENELNPLLLRAINENCVDDVEKFLADGAEVDCKTDSGVAAIALSARLANLNIFKLLLTKNPKIQGESKHGETILHHAVKGNNPKIVSALVGTKQLPKKYLDHKSHLDETPLKLAIKNNNPAIFAQLLKVGAQIHDADLVNEDIMESIREQIIRASLSPEQKNLNRQLLEVVKEGNTSTIINYVCNGGDVNSRNDFGETALMIACATANEETIEQLLKLGADVNAQNYFGGATAVHQAVQAAFFPVVKKLVAAGADLIIKDNNGLTPVLLAQQISRNESGVVNKDIEQFLLQAELRQNFSKKLFSATKSLMGLSIGVGVALASYNIWQKLR